MNYNRDISPVNLAFPNFNNDKTKIANILPPFPEFNSNKKLNDMEFDNLKEFRSRILEMDDEIKQLKNLEREKQLLRLKNPNQMFESQSIPKTILKDEAVSTTDSLLQEQTNRISELERQFEVLKKNSINTNYDILLNEENRNFNFQTDNAGLKRLEIDKEFEDEVNQKIGTWTPKDPYQGPMTNLYFPFGSPGGGAPRRDNQGRIQTMMIGQNNINIDAEERKRKILASHILQESLQQDMLQQRLRRLQDKQQNREPNGDFIEVISNFKGGRPKRDPLTGMLIDNHLPSSDITNMKLSSPRTTTPQSSSNSNPLKNSDILTYGMELTKAAKERQIMKHLDKLREQQECRQHVEAWNNIWGPRERYEAQKTYPITSHMISNHRNFYQLSK